MKVNNIIYELKDGKKFFDGLELNLLSDISLEQIVDKHSEERDYYDMKYEDKYLNNMRNGKGKEYNDNGFLIFEGEYLNGKRNGKGKEFDSKGNIIFEGEYNKIERRFNGKGKVYDKNGLIKYEFEYIHGRKKRKHIKELDKDSKLIIGNKNLKNKILKGIIIDSKIRDDYSIIKVKNMIITGI